MKTFDRTIIAIAFALPLVIGAPQANAALMTFFAETPSSPGGSVVGTASGTARSAFLAGLINPGSDGFEGFTAGTSDVPSTSGLRAPRRY